MTDVCGFLLFLGVATPVFTALHFVPGGFAEVLLGASANPEVIDHMNVKFGTD